VSSLTPGYTYYFQLLSVASDGTTSTASSVVYAATTATASTTCQISNLIVNPTIGVVNTTGQLVDSTGTPLPSDSFSLFANATSVCNNGAPGNAVTVAYYDSRALMQSTLTRNGGALTGVAGSAGTVWSVGNHPFTVYVGGTQYTPLTQQQVDVCQEQGATGRC
jgi:hypothetical protein